MSLSFDTRKCNPSLPADQNEQVVRDTIVMASMFHGFSEITVGNAPKIYARIHLLEMSRGAFMHKVVDSKLIDLYITPADIARWIGMTTNVSPISDAKFLKGFSNALRDFERAYQNEMKEKI